MTRTFPAALFAAGLATALVASQQVPTFRGGARVVSVYATVVGPGGRLITDLKQDDFEVRDNGVPQPVSVFTNDIQPITIVVMLDRSASVEEHFGLVRNAAEQFVSHLLPDDKARVGTFSTEIQLDPAAFTSDRAELLRLLRKPPQKAGPTPLWNAADMAMTALAPQGGRRVLLMFTDGRDNPGGESVGIEAVRHRAQTDEIMLYAIGLAPCAPQPAPRAAHLVPVSYQRRGGRGVPPIRLPGRGGFPWPTPIGGSDIPRRPLPPSEPESGDPCAGERPDPDLRALAEDNGGGYFELRGTDDLGLTFTRVALELHHQYLLGFTPAVLDGATHTLEVRVRQEGMTVRARTSYVAAPEK